MKRILLLSAVLLWAFGTAWAQQTVSGKVTSGVDGESLPGVAIQIKGTGQGTTTNIDGEYSLQVPSAESVLTYSFYGYNTEEIRVGNQTTMNVVLMEDIEQLETVVVTAVGISREQKALGYAVETVQGETIQQVAEPDALRALQGKVAGVNIGGSSGAPGSSTRITIRGNSSLLGNNQPLFVVDGIPYNNNSNNTFAGLTQGSANTSRIADLDPNNIASMTVLKGAAAAALYGTRAANGVVVITTKTGGAGTANKKLEVNIGSSISFEKIANLPDYQNTYGSGTNFTYSQVNGSWGAPFVGTRPYATTDSIAHWYDNTVGFEEFWGTKVPYRAYPNNVEDLFQTGHIIDNSVSISGGSDNTRLAVTVSRTDHEGYVPNTEFNRTNISVGGRSQLINKITIGGNLQYSLINQKAVQSGVGGSGANNPSAFARALYMGRNWDVHGQPYQNPVDLGSAFMVGRGQADNPLWSYENAGSREETDRIAASLDLGYNLTENLSATYKVGINSYNQNNLFFIRPGSTGPSAQPGVGQVTEDNIGFEEIESNFIINYAKDFSDKFTFSGLVGHNINQRTTDRQAFQGTNYVIFDNDDLDNTNDVIPFGGGFSQRRLVGVYADATFGFNNWAFLNLTARNDWSSTLPKDNNSFFYPAASLSIVLSDALEINSDFLNYLKLRAGAAQVGSDTGPYQLSSVYTVNPFGAFPFQGLPGATYENTLYNPELKPERTREFELGLDSRLLDNKIGLDLSVYDKNSFDLIAPISLPSVTGYSSFLTNFGTIKNRGIEIGLNINPIKNKNFSWDFYGTFTHNRNTIEELTEGIEEVTFGSAFAGGIQSVHRAGEEYGLLKGSVNARDDEGNLLIDPANGQLIPANDLAIVGNPNPDFIVGITNTLSYKGFRLSAVFDWREGGDLWSNTVLSLLGRGVTKDTENREMRYIIPGVYGDPTTLQPLRNTENGSKIPNQTSIDVNSLYFGNSFAINGQDEWAVFDATTYRLRELTLGYELPKTLIERTPFGKVSFAFTGRNLWFSAPGFPEHTNFDPEVNQFGNSNQQGVEWSATPTTKRYSFSVRLSF